MNIQDMVLDTVEAFLDTHPDIADTEHPVKFNERIKKPLSHDKAMALEVCGQTYMISVVCKS